MTSVSEQWGENVAPGMMVGVGVRVWIIPEGRKDEQLVRSRMIRIAIDLFIANYVDIRLVITHNEITVSIKKNTDWLVTVYTDS